MSFDLKPHQKTALKQMHNGCILCGGTGSGKSITGLAYYFTTCDGKVTPKIIDMKNPRNLYIITTAKKRDSGEWIGDMSHFGLCPDKEIMTKYSIDIVIDSWNNIQKYANVKNAFFIFDEQRVVGYGAWTKAFLTIAKNNLWILLSATPGDTYMDYMPVFIANGFYRNKTEFTREHVVYSPYITKYPQIEKFVGTGKLNYYRRKILVDMPYDKPAEQHHIDIYLDYDKKAYKDLCKTRWNYEEDTPIENASQFCYLLRKIVNRDESRINKVIDILKDRNRVIVFYNYDYELDILKNAEYDDNVKIAEWNGHRHEMVPSSSKWIYLVQYNAGAEGWNCITTDTMIFYSQNYSFKMMAQAAGRIDRLNTPFADLYYYHLKSKSGIDLAIAKALDEKKKFNESKFAG